MECLFVELLPVQGKWWENKSLQFFWTVQTDSLGGNSKVYTVKKKKNTYYWKAN